MRLKTACSSTDTDTLSAKTQPQVIDLLGVFSFSAFTTHVLTHLVKKIAVFVELVVVVKSVSLVEMLVEATTYRIDVEMKSTSTRSDVNALHECLTAAVIH